MMGEFWRVCIMCRKIKERSPEDYEEVKEKQEEKCELLVIIY